MDTTGGMIEKCPCGLLGTGESHPDNDPWQSRISKRRITGKDSRNTVHDATWTWHDGTKRAGSRGVCHANGATSHQENGELWPLVPFEGIEQMIEEQRERYGPDWPPRR